MTIFKLPDLGEGLQEAEIVAWHVNVGDHVVADQPLVSVETEKAVVEIPSPQAGRVVRLFREPGDIAKIGAPLVDLEAVGEVDAGTVVGEIPERRPTAAPPHQPMPEVVERIKAAPAVRALAHRLGVDLSLVAGSGPEGTATKADVEHAAATLKQGRLQPLRGVRRAMARNMERAHASVVPATVTDEADINTWKADEDVTLRLIRAICSACRAEPALNAWYLGHNQGRQLHQQVHLGIATDMEEGLFVPVMRNAENRDPADLRKGLLALKRDVAARKVPLKELRGGTITLSNFGMFGGKHAALVVVPPQVAIIGAGRIHEKVVPHDGKPEIRRVMPLSLTFDHRAVMGGEASRFLAAVIMDLKKTR